MKAARLGLVDTHAHVMDTAFDADRDAVVASAQAAGVIAMVLVGYHLSSSRAAVELARQIPGAVASVGIHPNYAAQAAAADFEALAELARSAEVVAIGETGLDNYRHHTSPARQRDALEWHVRLADELSLPLIVHNRDADAEIAEMLAEHAPGVLHCFSSTDRRFLERMLEAGFFVSFAGTLTFNNAVDLRAMAARVPMDRLLVETDCPYLAPMPHRGQRNEPAFVRDTAECLARVLDMRLDALADQLWANSVRVFPALVRVKGKEQVA